MKLLNIGCGDNFHKDWINLDLYNSEFVKYHNIKNKLPFPDSSIDAIYHSHVLEHLTKIDGEKFISECFRVLKLNGIMRVCVPDLEVICREYIRNLEDAYSTNDNNTIKNYHWNKLEIFDQIIRTESGGEMKKAITKNQVNKDYVIKRNGDEISPMFDNYLIKKDNLIIKILKNIYHKLVQFKRNPQKSGESHKWMYDKLDLKILLTKAGFKNFEITNFDASNIPNWIEYDLDRSKDGTRARKPDSIFVEVNK